MTPFILSAAMALVCLAIACAAAEVHPLQAIADWFRIQFAPDRSQDWAQGELTGEQQRGGRHTAAQAIGTETQRRLGDTMPLPRVTGDLDETVEDLAGAS
jgi:hypothetical protein